MSQCILSDGMPQLFVDDNSQAGCRDTTRVVIEGNIGGDMRVTRLSIIRQSPTGEGAHDIHQIDISTNALFQYVLSEMIAVQKEFVRDAIQHGPASVFSPDDYSTAHDSIDKIKVLTELYAEYEPVEY